MPDIEGRKYQVTLPDGRVVSRQYASQLRNKEVTKARERRYYEANRERIIAYQKEWNKKHLEETGMTYAQAYYNKNKEAYKEARRLAKEARKEATLNENPQQQ
jgi:hypothetical protein